MEDLSDLLQKELRLACAEISEKLSRGAHAGIWYAVAALFGLGTFFLVVEGLVFWLASTGLALHWSCFLIAVALAVIGALAFYYARARASEDLVPTRAARQYNQTVRIAKEQLR
jgi:hypothetical protein